ncbi:hypothetical protein SteCoe_39 [Stentor coeruleus]|uniref:Uncharacterized protein n=1 Tax=Stentor coeruleus TaxID=5963 RepID=A0A1R2D4W4_9CILI|nr:hypothetical protein SteCoe_39 [Stentor coeruleus]
MLKKPIKSKPISSQINVKSGTSIPVFLTSHRNSPKRARKSELPSKNPRTCQETPMNFIPQALTKRQSSAETRKSAPKIIIKEIIKVSHLKVQNRVKKIKSCPNEKNLTHLLVSPIQKIPTEFLGHDDKSLIKALNL